MTSILEKIITYKKQEVALAKKNRPLYKLEQTITTHTQRSFITAIANKVTQKIPAVIAEVKKASPSKGVIRADFDPVSIAKSYEHFGACCLSVLTDEKFFLGSNHDLQQIRSYTHLPILRKDFIIDPYQIFEANSIGADCILLIAAVLSDEDLQTFSRIAHSLNLAVLVEVHDHTELERALQLDTPLIGINNRNLNTFATSLETTLNLLSFMPENHIIITESGIYTRTDVATMLNHGVYGFLVGESLMRHPDPGEKLVELFSVN